MCTETGVTNHQLTHKEIEGRKGKGETQGNLTTDCQVPLATHARVKSYDPLYSGGVCHKGWPGRSGSLTRMLRRARRGRSRPSAAISLTQLCGG